MSKTITLRLNDDTYNLFRKMASNENRTLSNFIETSVLRFIEQNQFADEFEMNEIRNNEALNGSLRRAIEDAGQKRGRFIE